MADKALRAADKIVPRLSKSAKAEVCKITRSFLEDITQSIDRSNKRGDFTAVRIQALEAEWVKRFRSNC